ncbi:MAG TPA: GGDEF domain-containing protein [Solirubrobacterales bacterium]|nr:GGDEF domain-containing protein [Solirubrobacterales bacterium]
MNSTVPGPSEPQRRQTLRRGLAAFLIGGTVVVALHSWFGLGGPGLDLALNGVLYDAVVTGAAVACLLRAFAYRSERSAWLLIGLAVASWAAAEVYWTAFIEDNPEAPYPSPADAGYLLFYPLAYAGLALLIRARAHQMNWRLWTDGLIAALGTAALGAAFVFDFVADHATGTMLEKTITLAYPLGDIAMVSLLVGVVALTGWRPGRTWVLLLASLAATAVADVAYTLQWTAGALPGGGWIEPIYLISAACLGVAVWQAAPATIRAAERPGAWRELIVPGLFATVMIGLFAMHYLGSRSSLSTVLWTSTMVAVIVRLGLAARENRQLLEQVQTDPLTGLGNRGRMQIDLDTAAARATAERPVSLVFLDLNGFKRYNDTYGHPAGDDLLVRLGRALRDAIGENGTAYRVGGDEFCALLTCEPDRFDTIVVGAAEALSESGSKSGVDASLGSAVIPTEAPDAAEALRLADVRMYAQKERRRASESSEPDWPVPTATRPGAVKPES